MEAVQTAEFAVQSLSCKMEVRVDHNQNLTIFDRFLNDVESGSLGSMFD